MANPNKFTAKEVLNKVLLDSSGNAVTANSVTSQEALNSVLDTTNNRLNMSLAGGTISGDVTISGDLTVNGNGTGSYDEIVNGDLHVKSDSVSNSTSAFLVEKDDGTDVFVVDTTNSRVGINKTSPDEALHLSGNVKLFESGNTADKTYSSTGAGLFLTSYQSDSGSPYTKTSDIVAGSDGTVPSEIRFFTRNSGSSSLTQALKIDSNQQALFGKDVTVGSSVGAGEFAKLSFKANTTASGRYANITKEYDSPFTFQIEASSSGATAPIVFKNSNAQTALTLSASADANFAGNVGIGVSPSYPLHVSSTDSAILLTGSTQGRVILQDSGATSNYQAFDIVSVDDKLNFRRLNDARSGVNATVMTFDSDNVGIGETSIDAKLHLTTATAGLVNQKFESAGGAAWRIGIPASQTYFAFDNANDDLSAPKVVINSSGNLVIGQTSAQQKLEVHGGGLRIAGNITTPSSGVTGALIDYFGSDTRFWSRGADASTVGSFKFIGLENDGGNQSTRLEIDSSGLATFAGDVKLGVNKKIYAQSNSTNSIEFYNGATGAMNFVSGTSAYDYPMEFRQNDAQVMTIKTQRVGIGTQSPDTLLHIEQAGGATLRITNSSDGASDETHIGTVEFEGSDGSTNRSGVMAKIVASYSDTGSGDSIDGSANEGGSLGFYTSIATTVGGAQTLAEKMRIENNGNVAIGTTSVLDGGGSKTVLTISDDAQAVLVFEDTGYESSGDGLGMFAYNDGTLTYRTSSRSGTDWAGSTNRLVIDAFSSISLSNNDSGTANTIFGKNAGYNLDAGSNYNVFIGQNVSDASMDDATFNTGMGYEALSELTSGDYNVSIGAYASQSNTTPSFNTVLGTFGLQKNINGEHNTALGYTAGKFSPAGAANVTSPDQCVIIGSLTEFSSATPLNQIVIGYNADGLADNTVTLGNSDITDVYMAQDSGATVHCDKIQMLNYRIIQKDFGALSSGSSHDIGTANANFAGTIKMWTNHNSGSGYIEYSLVYSTNAKALSLIHQNQPYAPSTVTLSLDTSTGTVSTSSLSYNTDVHIVVESMNTQFTFA
jgi:hypothetical protein